MGEVFKYPCTLSVFYPHVPDDGVEHVDIHWLEPYTLPEHGTAYWQTAILKEIKTGRVLKYEIGMAWPDIPAYIPPNGSPYHWRGTTEWVLVGYRHATAYECVLEARRCLHKDENGKMYWEEPAPATVGLGHGQV